MSTDTGSKEDCNYRKICMGIGYDTHESVCCDNRIRAGRKLAFNPAVATCCKVGHGCTLTATATHGLSERVSACCGFKAYNPLDELCCQATIVAKPVPKAQCCGEEAFDEDKQLCCGPNHDKRILTRTSRLHRCCGRDQYYTVTHCCCSMNDVLQIKPIHSSCCVEDTAQIPKGLRQSVSPLRGLHAQHPQSKQNFQSTIAAKIAPKAKYCDKEAFDEDKQLCCGPNHDKRILTRTSRLHRCCGRDQYYTVTHCCCSMNDVLQIKPIHSSCCVEDTAQIPKILRQSVSPLRGLHAQHPQSKQNFQSTIAAKIAPKAKYCDKEAFDEDKQLCCGPNHDKRILTRTSRLHRCCGRDQYYTVTHCCCSMNDVLQIKPIHSSCCVEDTAQIPKGLRQSVSPLRGLHAQHPQSKQNFQSTIAAKIAPKAKYCDKEPFDMGKQLCCGLNHKKRILTRKSCHHQCCGHNQFDTETECCCWTTEFPEILPINSSCCANESGVHLQKPAPQRNCTEPNTRLCGSSCYNPDEFSCCERNQTKPHLCCSPGQCDAVLTVYNPRTQVSWDGCVSEWKPDIDQFHGSSGQHCCGTEIYQPDTDICCGGHRHPKNENSHCCGIQAYNIKDPQLKCCAGTLYNLKSLHSHDAQCCGSILQDLRNQDVCCSSEDKEGLYPNKPGFRCCGHLYYNSSLFSCCAGKLSPVHQPGQHQGKLIIESRFLSVSNLKETDLCKEMKIGTVQSVSLHSIVFSSVLKIHGINATVKTLPSPYILKTPDHCNFPKMIPGKTYFFDEVNVFTDFSHDSTIQSLHFIIYKCYRP
ncbi:uncharacterized protein si:ch211-195m9.3 [Xiphias gladius]|uniref:uncharacterized protein si:ch211-195m9.3 n=1 Tax=Xiphias gladius TaxID=8245 RepID=UPI001A987DB8|nr:uncharacterized protein si:ch211-195m9.3 [Xiphias gladius]